MGLFTPFPGIRHLRPGNCLDVSPDRGLAQLISAGPGRVVSATHVADFVNSVLEGGDSAANESFQEIIACQPFPLELVDELVNLVDLGVRLLWIELPIKLLRGSTEAECRQVQEIGVVRALVRVLHVEERALPLPA